MSTYWFAPRQGHLNRLKRMYGCLCCNPSGARRFRVNIPNHEGMSTPVQYDWSSSVYGNGTEELPPDQPKRRCKLMSTNTYQDANLYHDLTPIISLCNKQKTVVTATYKSELMVASQAAQQIIDLRCNLRMMGIPLDGPSLIFCNSNSVITSSTIPHSTLNKRLNVLYYHCVRKCIASKILYLLHCSERLNLTGMLIKPLCWFSLWPLVQHSSSGKRRLFKITPFL
jgi:hypothetical protein